MDLSVHKGHGPSYQVTMNMIPVVVSDDSLKNWPKHGRGSVCDFKQPFSLLVHRSDSKLVLSTHHFERFDLIYITYIWCRLQKVTIFATIKNISLNLSRFTCMTNRDSESGFETTPGLLLMSRIQWRIDKWAFVKNRIFGGKFDCLDLHEISITWYLVLCFENRA